MPGATVLPRIPSALVIGSAEELLAGPGCPARAYVAEAAGRRLAWLRAAAFLDGRVFGGGPAPSA